jgi:hypothetical protein
MINFSLEAVTVCQYLARIHSYYHRFFSQRAFVALRAMSFLLLAESISAYALPSFFPETAELYHRWVLLYANVVTMN